MEHQLSHTDTILLHDMERFVMSRAIGFIYLYPARAIIRRFGKEGEKAIRRACREFGKYRGERWKAWHMELGLPNNLESFATFNDTGSTQACGCFGPDMILTPYYTEFTAKHCPLHTTCQEQDFESEGYIYCDEMHLELLKGYNPAGVLEIHENLMKGDDGCHFMVVLPKERAEVQVDKSKIEAMLQEVRKNPVEYQRLMLKREGLFMGMLYYFITRTAIERFGREAQEAITASLLEMGKKRGQELKERLRKATTQPPWENIWDHFDLAYKYSWGMKQEKVSDDRSFQAIVESCPLAEIWKELGDKDIGPAYCDTQYTTMFKELNGQAEITIPRCLSKGDTQCRFEFRI
ncbi:MAG: L-2-amino-thiazoline-4-carboxylic acid hydrolase [Thermodesulfobacteriota bacterium]